MSHGSDKSASLEPPPGCCDSSHQRPVLWAHGGCSMMSSPWLSAAPHICCKATFPVYCETLLSPPATAVIVPRPWTWAVFIPAPTHWESAHPQQLPNTFIEELHKPLSYHKTSTDLEPPWSTASCACPIYLPQSPHPPKQRRACSQQIRVIPKTFM